MDYELKSSPIRDKFSLHSEVPGYALIRWTPTVWFGGTEVTSFDYIRGTCIKIGDLVWLEIAFSVSSVGAASGGLQIKNLPVNRVVETATTNQTITNSIHWVLNTNFYGMTAKIVNSGISVYGWTAATNHSMASAVTDTDFAAGLGVIHIDISYHSALRN